MKYALSLAALVLGAAPAHAADEHFYGQIGGSSLQFDGDVLSNPDGEYNVSAISVAAGGQNQNFGFELELDFGVQSAEVYDDAFNTNDTVSVSTMSGLFGRVGFNPVDQLHVFARAGLMGGTVKVRIEDAQTGAFFEGEDGVNGFAYGVGALFDMTEKTYLRFDYTRFDMESDDDFTAEGNRFGVSLGMRFQ